MLTHLTDPKNLVYMLGMEGELIELNVRTLKTKRLFALTKELGTPGHLPPAQGVALLGSQVADRVAAHPMAGAVRGGRCP